MATLLQSAEPSVAINVRTPIGLFLLNRITQSRSGVFVILFGQYREEHYSYHTNGTSHFKIRKAGSARLTTAFGKSDRRQPIREIQNFQQMLCFSIRFPGVGLDRITEQPADSSSAAREIELDQLDKEMEWIVSPLFFIANASAVVPLVNSIESSLHSKGGRILDAVEVPCLASGQHKVLTLISASPLDHSEENNGTLQTR